MSSRVAIIGSGPTGIYTFAGLAGAGPQLSISIFEVEADPGKGTPYHPDINDQAMLANIASVELPPVYETLVAWLRRQPDELLQRLNVNRANINERQFYPRVVLGEYLQSQFHQVIEKASANGHQIDVKPLHRVVDIKLMADEILLTVRMPNGDRKDYTFDHVVMATGHNWPETTEIKPGYFISPWPAHALKAIGACSVGILGTSLSAIDALVTVATAHGIFYLDAGGQLQYQGAGGSDGFQASLMSRKGILPEADFYCEYPYQPLQYCTAEAVDALIAQGSAHLLDSVFALFKRELAACDPDYSARIGLSLLTADTFAEAYFAERESTDPLTWASSNLAEAERNKIDQYTVPWRYAILRMHEVAARAVPHLDQDDLDRFHARLKGIFVDDYATVPHESIKRLLALWRAGRLRILKLGNDYRLDTRGAVRGVCVIHGEGKREVFEAFIDATGQAALSARDLPFPSLLAQGAIRQAATPDGGLIASGATEEASVRTGGVDLDEAFRPLFTSHLCNQLYCAAISFLLHKLPFVQGITSAHEIGNIVSSAILDHVNQKNGAFELDSV